MSRIRHKTKLSLALLAALFVFFLNALSVFAQTDTSARTESLPNPLAVQSIPELAGLIIKAVLGITGSVALIMVIYGGFLWLTAAGNSERIEKGRNTLTWAIIGLIVIFGSYLLIELVIEAITGAR